MTESRILKVLHWIIILNFALGILYGAYLSMFVFGGGGVPLFGRASQEPVEVILKRRLYSVETWIAISGLAVYLALTEIMPRRVAGWLSGARAEADRESVPVPDQPGA